MFERSVERMFDIEPPERRTVRVFTNGCFDVLHVGHKRLLEWARSQGSWLVVGLNSDESIKRIRGKPPVNPCDERYEMIAAYPFVSDVVVFDEDTPLRLITEIRPAIIVKGPEYRWQKVVGSEIAEVRYPSWEKEHSSGMVIDRILAREGLKL